MTPEQMADRDSVWSRMEIEHPEFTREMDCGENYHACREIVLGGSVTWRRANGYFQPWKGKRVLDIGANHGVYSAFCGANGADVIAFEPHPVIFPKLKNMLDSTGLSDKVQAVNAAVWTFTGHIPYIAHVVPNEDVTCCNGGLQTNGVHWTAADIPKISEVACIDIDEVLDNRDWDMVKIDIEGGEYEMLLSASVDALKRIRFSFLEFHDWASQDLYDETIKKLESIFRCEYYRAEGSTGRYETAYLFKR